MIFETGRVVMKIAGRDSGKTAVIVNKIDDNYVLIDGDVRRKKCNISHLEPTEKTLKKMENELQQKYLEFQMLEQELRQMEKQIVLVQQQIIELRTLTQNIEDIKDVKS